MSLSQNVLSLERRLVMLQTSASVSASAEVPHTFSHLLPQLLYRNFNLNFLAVSCYVKCNYTKTSSIWNYLVKNFIVFIFPLPYPLLFPLQYFRFITSDDTTTEFVAKYLQPKCLWNVKSPVYKNKQIEQVYSKNYNGHIRICREGDFSVLSVHVAIH